MRRGECSRPHNDSRVFNRREIEDTMLQFHLIIGKPCIQVASVASPRNLRKLIAFSNSSHVHSVTNILLLAFSSSALASADLESSVRYETIGKVSA